MVKNYISDTSRNMHINLAPFSRFESTDVASVLFDGVPSVVGVSLMKSAMN